MSDSYAITSRQPDPELTPLHEQLIALALDSVDSPHSKRMYRLALTEFYQWHLAQGEPTHFESSHPGLQNAPQGNR